MIIGVNDFNNACTYNLKCIEVIVSTYQIAVVATGNSDFLARQESPVPADFAFTGSWKFH